MLGDRGRAPVSKNRRAAPLAREMPVVLGSDRRVVPSVKLEVANDWSVVMPVSVLLGVDARRRPGHA